MMEQRQSRVIERIQEIIQLRKILLSSHPEIKAYEVSPKVRNMALWGK
jgi:hypothetical protein